MAIPHVMDLVAPEPVARPRLTGTVTAKRMVSIFTKEIPAYTEWAFDVVSGQPDPQVAGIPLPRKFLLPTPLQSLLPAVVHLQVPWRPHGDDFGLMPTPTDPTPVVLSGTVQEATDWFDVMSGVGDGPITNVLMVWTVRHRYTEWLKSRDESRAAVTAARRHETAAADAAVPHVQVALDALRTL